MALEIMQSGEMLLNGTVRLKIIQGMATILEPIH
jgi:hypothetical protein